MNKCLRTQEYSVLQIVGIVAIGIAGKGASQPVLAQGLYGLGKGVWIPVTFVGRP